MFPKSCLALHDGRGVPEGSLVHVAPQTQILRKTSQEVEIDHLLAEEFSCDPSFTARFVAACGLACSDFTVTAAAAEPSLGGDGFGDLLIEGIANGSRAILLIEDKITAGPAFRQAERYAAFASRLRADGCDQVWTILVAPSSYHAERTAYDATLNLETVQTLIQSVDPRRRAYRQDVIARALGKKAGTGVRIPDAKLHRLRCHYLDQASGWCAVERAELAFPPLRDSYYDGDSWIDPIRSRGLPRHVWLRHRLWTSVKDGRGCVDLIMCPPTAAERNAAAGRPPANAVVAPFSNGKGVQVSVALPEMRQTADLDPETLSQALNAMTMLIAWYRDHVTPSG